MFHLAEYLYKQLPRREYRARSVLGEPENDWWLRFDDIELDDSDFHRLGKDFETDRKIEPAAVGCGHARLFRASVAVDYAVGWMRRERR